MGTAVGLDVGEGVGAAVGFDVGEGVGAAVLVGFDVGEGVGHVTLAELVQHCSKVMVSLSQATS